VAFSGSLVVLVLVKMDSYVFNILRLSIFKPSKTKRRLFYLKTQLVLHSKHFSTRL